MPKENQNLLQSGLQKVSRSVSGAVQGIGAGVRRRPRIALAVGAVVLCAGVGTLIAFKGLPDSELLDSVAHTVVAKPTLAELSAKVKAEPKNASAWLELGHAQWDADKRLSAIASYDQALTLDKSLASGRVVDNLTSCFGEKCQPQAQKQLVDHKLTAAEGKLVELTASKRYGVRNNAVNTLERLGLASKVNYVAVYTLDLQSNDCEIKREAVEQLGKRGNKEAISALRAARKKEEAETPWYAFDCIGGRAQKAEQQILARR